MNRKRSNNIKGHPCAPCSCPVDKKALAHNDVLFSTCISFLMLSDPALFLFTDHLYYFLTSVVPFSPDWPLFIRRIFCFRLCCFSCHRIRIQQFTCLFFRYISFFYRKFSDRRVKRLFLFNVYFKHSSICLNSPWQPATTC